MNEARAVLSPLARGTNVETPETRAERAFHLGSADAWDRCPPAHASCWRDPISNFSQFPSQGGRRTFRDRVEKRKAPYTRMPRATSIVQT